MPPGYKIVPCRCECGAQFENTYDFELHKKNCNRTNVGLPELDKLPWKTFKKGNGEWIFSDRSTLLRDYIRQGHNIIGDHRYWLYGEGKFIGRRKK
jgi:hypothetical protein